MTKDASVSTAHVVVDENVDGRVESLQYETKTSNDEEQIFVLSVDSKLWDQAHGNEDYTQRDEASNEQCGDHDNHLSYFGVPVRNVVSLAASGGSFPPFCFAL